MNMLTGDYGMASDKVFFSQAVDSVGLKAPQALFPKGETGRTAGEWKTVNRPYTGLFGIQVDNWVVEWVDESPVFNAAVGMGVGRIGGGVPAMGVGRIGDGGVPARITGEGVLVQPSIQQVGTGNVFSNQCPAGTIDFGLSCKYPDEMESCNADETDTGMMCQVPIKFENGIMSGGNIRAKQMRFGKMVPK